MRAMCGVHVKDNKKDMILMLVFNRPRDHLAMAGTLHWYGHVLRRDDGHVRRSLSFEVEGKG